ncbi:hypothetical protein KQX54_007454 [Cotesia glomerata]|uniref:Uncharacterized protein n=1 Tax=Cotesia glomerata TaxID=32391 RepID=A0AAV7IG73_COTGL|nr:hypothetical protein KQX54_007454 [Cotesia glomerata]
MLLVLVSVLVCYVALWRMERYGMGRVHHTIPEYSTESVINIITVAVRARPTGLGDDQYPIHQVEDKTPRANRRFYT